MGLLLVCCFFWNDITISVGRRRRKDMTVSVMRQRKAAKVVASEQDRTSWWIEYKSSIYETRKVQSCYVARRK